MNATITAHRDLRSAGCAERRTSGAGSGPEKLTSGNTGRALRSDFHQNFLTLPGSVDDMLAEARGFRLGLVLAHQNLAQLPRETQAAISANARSKVYFTVEPDDARELSKHTKPELSDHDLAHLDVHTAASRLLVDNRELPAFTFTTNPPSVPLGQAAEIRTACAERNRKKTGGSGSGQGPEQPGSQGTLPGRQHDRGVDRHPGRG